MLQQGFCFKNEDIPSARSRGCSSLNPFEQAIYASPSKTNQGEELLRIVTPEASLRMGILAEVNLRCTRHSYTYLC